MAILLERPDGLGDRLAQMGARRGRRAVRHADALPVPGSRAEPVAVVLDLPRTDAVLVRRALVATLAGHGARLARVRDGLRRWRDMAPAELLLWSEQMVRTADVVAGDRARAVAAAGDPTGVLPCYVVVAPDALVLRWQRGVMGVADAEQLLHALVRAGAADRATVRAAAAR